MLLPMISDIKNMDKPSLGVSDHLHQLKEYFLVVSLVLVRVARRAWTMMKLAVLHVPWCGDYWPPGVY